MHMVVLAQFRLAGMRDGPYDPSLVATLLSLSSCDLNPRGATTDMHSAPLVDVVWAIKGAHNHR